ncbi:MAG: hypothetical protein ACRDG8_12745 [Actinomycetota bacterium]
MASREEKERLMNRKSMWVAGGIVVIAVIGGGTAIAATSGDTEETPLTEPALSNATEAALAHTAGTVTETEMGDDGAAYGVEIRRQDGSEVEISLDENFEVVGEEVDDDRDDDRDDDKDDDGTDDRDD